MATGKYAAIIDKLPKFGGQDPSYQEKVNAVKTAILAENPEGLKGSTLAQKYYDFRIEKDAVEEVLSEINLRGEAISQLLADTYEAEGVSSLHLSTGPTVRIQYEPYSSVVNRDSLREWAVTNGMERDLQLPWMTLNALTKERLLQGLSEPDGVAVSVKHKIVMTKG